MPRSGSFILGIKSKSQGLKPTTAPEASRRSQISRQLVYEGGKVVSPTHWPPLHRRKESGYSFLLEVESIPGP